MSVTFVLPELGENIESGTVTAVLVSVGDAVKKDQTVVELETDKAVLDVPSPETGIVIEINVKEGDTLRVGDVVLVVDESGATAAPEPEPEVARDDHEKSVSPDEVEKDVAPEGEEPSTAEAGPESEVTEEGEEEPKEEGVLSDEEWDALPAMRYRADGQDWEIPGSKVEEDGVFIPTDQVGHINQLLAQGQDHQGPFQQTLQAHEPEAKNP
ncbi:MAG: hypothetical protein IIB38_16290, partial [Candidatus Hydrogenedentes bacterium]|nr:hypothetical protein [Candidatus Hydrogenedentota bacterium]